MTGKQKETIKNALNDRIETIIERRDECFDGEDYDGWCMFDEIYWELREALEAFEKSIC